MQIGFANLFSKYDPKPHESFTWDHTYIASRLPPNMLMIEY